MSAAPRKIDLLAAFIATAYDCVLRAQLARTPSRQAKALGNARIHLQNAWDAVLNAGARPYFKLSRASNFSRDDVEPSARDFNSVRRIVKQAVGFRDGMSALAEYAETRVQGLGPRLARLAEAETERRFARRLSSLIRQRPLPDDVGFLHFGLATTSHGRRRAEVPGLYVAAGKERVRKEGAHASDFDFILPKSGFLRLQVLSSISAAGRALKERAFTEYAIVLGASALLAKCCASILHATCPVYVGFDSGDHMRVR